MLRLTNLANVYKRRTLRVLYGNSQAYPYAATLSAAFNRTANQLTGAALTAGSKAAINPGSVAVKLAGEIVTLLGSSESGGVATDTGPTVRPFGLFANFVGGELDEIGTSATEVGVWRGPGSVYEVLAPAFNDAGGAGMSVASAEAGTVGTDIAYVVGGTDGRLVQDSAALSPFVASHKAVGRVIARLSANAIIVECLV